MTAVYLALVDRRAARQLLESLEPYAEAIGTGQSRVGRRDWLMAWALADPPRALELAKQELDGAQDEDARRRARSAVHAMVSLWTRAPTDRLEYLLGYARGSLSIE